MEGMLVDHQQYMRNPLRLFPDNVSEMDAAMLTEKARSALGLGLNLGLWGSASSNSRPTGPMTQTANNNSRGHPELNSLPVGSLPFFSHRPTSLANAMGSVPPLYPMANAGRPNGNMQLPLPLPAAQFWSQWSTLHGLGLGLNQLGLLGLGFGAGPGVPQPPTANHEAATNPQTSPQTPRMSLSPPHAYQRYSPYPVQVKRSPSPPIAQTETNRT